jgi:hypothetical protein
MARLKSPKSKGDGYERDLAEFFNTQLLAGVHRRTDFRRAPLSGGGVTDSTFDLTGTDIVTAGFAQNGSGLMALTYAREGRFELGIEAKRTERINVWEAMEQAVRHRVSMAERGYDITRVVPMVITRKNHVPIADSLVVMKLSDLIRLIRGD